MRPKVSAIQVSPRRASGLMAWIPEGRSNAAIARRLRVSEKAVVHNASNIYDELGLQASQHDLSSASGRIPALDGEPLRSNGALLAHPFLNRNGSMVCGDLGESPINPFHQVITEEPWSTQIRSVAAVWPM
jgi:Bacterial regulatory proteins, luxR family.